MVLPGDWLHMNPWQCHVLIVLQKNSRVTSYHFLIRQISEHTHMQPAVGQVTTH